MRRSVCFCSFVALIHDSDTGVLSRQASKCFVKCVYGSMTTGYISPDIALCDYGKLPAHVPCPVSGQASGSFWSDVRASLTWRRCYVNLASTPRLGGVGKHVMCRRPGLHSLG